MAEAPGLGSVAVYLDSLVLSRGLNKSGNHHSVLSCLPGADGIKETDHDYRKPRFLPMGQRKKFVKSLGTGICPAVFIGRAGEEVVIFAKGNGCTLAVYLGRAGNQHTFSVTGAEFEDRVGTVKDRFDRFHGLLHDEPHAHCACHVINAVGIPDQFFEQAVIENRIDDQFESVVSLEMLDVRVFAGRKVVDNGYLVSLADQFVGKMAADEAGSAGDKYFHI